MIQDAILDFSKTSKIYKKNSIFSIKNGELEKEIIVLRIGVNNMNILFNKDSIGKTSNTIPSKFVEKNGKLFFWWDSECKIQDNTISTYRKYNILQDNENGLITIPEFSINDNQKSVYYFFCRTNLTQYKRITTNKGLPNDVKVNLKCR
jgi:hypothetical protein